MTRAVEAKELAKLCSQLSHYKRLDISVEYLKSSAVQTFAGVRPDVNPNGRPTGCTVGAIQDGPARFFDGNYESEVTALLAESRRLPEGKGRPR